MNVYWASDAASRRSPEMPGRSASTSRRRVRDGAIVSESLLQRVTAGDVSAMQMCIDTYGGLVWSLARRFSRSPADAEDGVQEVFIALWENAERFDPALGAEVTFVAMIARRRLIDRGRAGERRQRHLEEARRRTIDATSSRPDERETPLNTQSDEVQRALDAIETLSPAQQRVLQLAIHHGYTHEQIAEITETPLGTVKSNVRRGLQRIRSILEPAIDGRAAT